MISDMFYQINHSFKKEKKRGKGYTRSILCKKAKKKRQKRR